MSETKPDKRQTKAGKLHLNRETLRDLSASENAAKKAMGGAKKIAVSTGGCGSPTL
jgi:hypothetical protein